MSELFGLPAHPLLVHFPIVAIPALAILALAFVVLPNFRRTYSLPGIAFALVTAVSTFLAAQSGEALADTYSSTDFLDKHESLGEALRLFVLGLTVSMIGLIAAGKRSAATGKDPLSLIISVLVLVFAVLSLIWTIRTGHEGARLRWG